MIFDSVTFVAMKQEITAAAKTLWNYHLMHHPLKKSDCILVLGSHDLRPAERAAELFLDGYAPFILFSGGLGNFTREWKEPEAEKFGEVAMKMGVPQSALLLECKSTNTGENILFSKQLLKDKNIEVRNLILVQKPYMERRSFATISKQWPEVEVLVTSPAISFEDYPNDEIPADKVINIMVGDLQRIIEYPKKGFQIAQQVPDEVMNAFRFLVNAGYDKHLMKQ